MSSIEILKALKALRKRADGWWLFGVPRNFLGICGNLSHLLDGDGGGFVVARLSKGWPEHSGDGVYPIVGGVEAYWKTRNKWSGEQGEARKRLLDYMIAKLEQEISGSGTESS